MKNLIKNLVSRFGYKIERADNPNPLDAKYRKLLTEHFGCYRDLKFKNLPELTDICIDLIRQLDGTQVSEAVYILSALENVKHLRGDVCEFGVAQGFTSALIGHSINSTEKHFWLFDSFEGLPAPTVKDKLKDDIFNLKNMEAYTGTMKHGMEKVKHNLQAVHFPVTRTHIIDGFIEQTILTATLPSKVSFAYVDFDFYNPIKIALEFLDQILVPTGVIIVDDYDFFSEGAKIAVDEFYARRTSKYSLELPIPSAGHFALLTKLGNQDT